MRSHARTSLALLIGLLALAGSAAHAQTTFTLTNLGDAIDVGGVNSSGQVVGRAYAGASYAFSTTSGGSMVNLGTLGGTNSSAFAINAAGQIVGQSEITSNTSTHAFSTTSGGIMVDLGTLGGFYSYATAINAAGQIVGRANTIGGAVHAFSTTSGGSMVDLGTFGGTNSYATGINSSGQIVGYANTTSDAASHAFHYTSGVMYDIGTLGGQSSYAHGINDLGQIVGLSHIFGGALHAFSYTIGGSGMVDLGLFGGAYGPSAINAAGQIVGGASFYTGGTIYDLNTLITGASGFSVTSATGINDLGQIVGIGSDGESTIAFLLTPIPEPSTFAMFASVSALGLAIARRRKLTA